MGSPTAAPLAPPKAALDLQEALASRPSAIDGEGNVLIHIIRPTVGLGKGRHKYPAEMLQENAEVFTGWRMHIDHESPEAKRARGHLPRSIQELGGRIMESWWDPTVPAAGRYEQGAVVGKVKPVGQVKMLIEEDPELLEASIRAKASGVRSDTENGEQVWVVEGIRRDPPGSVDWVSEGGAGGRVADLIEALVRDGDAEDPENHAEGGDEVSELLEALRDPESEVARAVTELAEAKAEEKVAEATEQHEKDLQEATAQHEYELREAREEAATEARDDVKRLEGFKDKAHGLIEGAKLPEPLTKRLKGRFDLQESGDPTDALDAEDEESLVEAVNAEIQEGRDLLAEVNPARVEGQGAGKTDGDAASAAKPADKPFHREWLEEATGMDADEVWPTEMEITTSKEGE